MWSFILKIIKFGLTGLLGMSIDFSATWLCKEKLHINKYIANATGFTLAVICNYYINRRWTFNSQNPLWMGEFYKFVIISIIGLGFNTLFLYIFHKRKQYNFYLAKFLAILLVFIWNFSANFFITFRNLH